MKKIRPILLLLACGLWHPVFSQIRVSGSTDMAVLRSFKQDQRYWGYCLNVTVDWHFTTKGGAYVSVGYSSDGKFTNQLSATAKAASTSPQEITFTNNAEMGLKEISLGFKHYFLGGTDSDTWNLYSIIGFGLMLGKVTNSHSQSIDTSLYNAPEQPVSGTGHFKRLTLDLGLGVEFPLRGDMYLYMNGKVWIPTSDYPSKYLFVNDDAPLIGVLGFGIRILF